jgi:hypothetical protein
MNTLRSKIMTNKKFALIFVMAWIFLSVSLMAKESDHNVTFLKPGQDVVARSMVNIGNWGLWIRYDGQSAHTPDNNSGGFYPRGTAAVIYQDGVVYGAKVIDVVPPITPQDPKIRVGGQTYRIGTSPGWITTSGDGNSHAQRIDANNSRLRLYRVRWDYTSLLPDDPTDITQWDPSIVRDAQDQEQLGTSADVTAAMCQDIWDKYDYSWNNWPVDLGAPYYDVNGNGVYDSGYEEDLNDDGTISLGEREEPGVANADQIVWFVVNDVDSGAAALLYGSAPIGIETQVTMWNYNQPGGTLGQIIFKQFLLINKSGYRLDSMFVAQWSDPDVGVYTDDLAGVDIERSLGFAYSGQLTDGDYDDFGLAPSAGGYDFFAGPIVESPGDTAIFNLQYRAGYRNLPMTSFSFFAAGSPIEDPDLGEYVGTMQWYNMLNGYVPTSDSTLGTQQPYVVGAGLDAGQSTKFPLSGDPFRVTGDIDAFGTNFGPGDRRIVLSSGPFTMQPGDSQTVVLAVVGGNVDKGQGGNNRNAVEQMKINDDFAQFIFNNLFQGIPSPPAAPAVTVTPFSDHILFDWGTNQARVVETEKDDPVLGFNFEGYNVYQLPSSTATKAAALRVATFDVANFITIIRARKFVAEFSDILIVPIQYGSDSGIQRFFKADKDYIRDLPLYAGNEYYWAVTAYNFNADPTVPEPSLESALNVIAVTPQPSKPGTEYTHATGEELAVTASPSAANNTGDMTAFVVDPAKTLDAGYEVRFRTISDDSLWYKWDLVRIVGGSETVLLSNQENLEGGNDYPIVDGIQVKPVGPKIPGLAGWAAPTGERWFSGTNWGAQEFFGGLDIGANFFGSDLGTNVNPVHMEWQDQASVDAEGYWSKGAVYRRDLGYAFQGIGEMPFRAFDVLDPANPRQINVCFVEDDREGAAGANANLIWDMGWNGTEFGANGAREYLFFNASDYDEGATYAGGIDGTSTDVYFAIWPASRSRPYLLAEFTFDIYANIPNKPGDVYSLETKAAKVGDTDMAKDDVDKINVFPNPYYAYNPSEPNRFQRFVTFNHLPEKLTVRIFTISGVLVRTLTEEDKSAPDSQFLQWDLLNESDFPVASGVYIAHIDMPELGKTKVLKLFIVQGQEILQYF